MRLRSGLLLLPAIGCALASCAAPYDSGYYGGYAYWSPYYEDYDAPVYGGAAWGGGWRHPGWEHQWGRYGWNHHDFVHHAAAGGHWHRG